MSTVTAMSVSVSFCCRKESWEIFTMNHIHLLIQEYLHAAVNTVFMKFEIQGPYLGEY
jgi:hypothetical protein